MEETHYIRVTDAVFESFGEDPNIIMDWILFIHETKPDATQLFSLEETPRMFELLQQIEVLIDRTTQYNLSRAVIGEELIVNEKKAAIVGILPFPLLVLATEVMNSFDQETLGAIFDESDLDGAFEPVWTTFCALRSFFKEAETAKETLLIYYT